MDTTTSNTAVDATANRTANGTAANDAAANDATTARASAAGFGNALSYLLSGLPLGIAAFTCAVTGFALALGTLVIWIGLPILTGTLLLSGFFANLERRRVAVLGGPRHPQPPPPTRTPPRPTGVLGALNDPRPWLDLAHALLSFPLRVVSFCVALTWTVGGVGELLYVTWSWSLPRDEGETGLLDLMIDVSSRGADIAFHTAVGVVLLATALPVVRALTAAQTGLARALLRP
ncbi:sensor domain-containing protein [Streptomyces sp. 4N509B]|uniref:sensor domain-containing protein n=1 Tax=Streptomyces sp. 4N509B TaxID=3457413 RepID=UPI003FD38E4B